MTLDEMNAIARMYPWDKPTVETSESGLWLLYGLVRFTRPEVVIEAGACNGIGSMFLSRAVADNGFGHVYAYEISERRFGAAQDSVKDFPECSMILGDFMEVEKPACDFLFMDIDPKQNYIEAYRSVTMMEGRPCTIAAHDLTLGAEGYKVQAFMDILKSEGWTCLGLPQERGMGIAVRW